MIKLQLPITPPAAFLKLMLEAVATLPAPMMFS